ncbi:TPA: hypothetical protein SIE49_004286 [Escherichia coli]|nr:hypothetical protein [Escherichia coli]HEI0187816.1 hypothetical protein [Escherichia coli]
MQKKSDHDVNLQCLTLQVALTMDVADPGLRKQEHYFLPRGVHLAVNPARSSDRLSPGKDQK